MWQDQRRRRIGIKGTTITRQHECKLSTPLNAESYCQSNGANTDRLKKYSVIQEDAQRKKNIPTPSTWQQQKKILTKVNKLESRQGNESNLLVTDFVPSEMACLASSPGKMRRTDVWISREEIVDFLE